MKLNVQNFVIREHSPFLEHGHKRSGVFGNARFFPNLITFYKFCPSLIKLVQKFASILLKFKQQNLC